jgi:hypothetical protein
MGNATAAAEKIAVTAGNVSITATATGVGAAGIVLGTNAGDAFTIDTLNSVSNQGNITLPSGLGDIRRQLVNKHRRGFIHFELC